MNNKVMFIYTLFVAHYRCATCGVVPGSSMSLVLPSMYLFARPFIIDLAENVVAAPLIFYRIDVYISNRNQSMHSHSQPVRTNSRSKNAE
ncbi:hypothetical protein V8C43DRAFT_299269 [Trichoderma afarasin]